MYNRQQKGWESAEYEESLLLWCRESFNRENPEALYILADYTLGKASSGKETADAVYQMEKAAGLAWPGRRTSTGTGTISTATVPSSPAGSTTRAGTTSTYMPAC